MGEARATSPLAARVIFYRRFPGDFLRDTMDLSAEQVGWYTLLLDHLYATEKPIPDIESACRVARVVHWRLQPRLQLLISRFFQLTENGYWHKRVDKELTYAESRKNKARTAAESRWKHSAPSIARAMPKQCYPDSRLQTPDKERVNLGGAEAVENKSSACGASSLESFPENGKPQTQEGPPGKKKIEQQKRYALIGQLATAAQAMLSDNSKQSHGDLSENLKQWAAERGLPYFDMLAGCASPIEQAITIARARLGA